MALTVSEIDTELEKIDRAIANPASRIDIGDKSIAYSTTEQLIKKRTELQRRRAELAGSKRKRVLKLNARKGL